MISISHKTKYTIRLVIKWFEKVYLELRGLFYNSKGPQNIYILTTQKSGSQWIKKLLNDKNIRSKTKLMLFPQQRYDSGDFRKSFPKGTFIPGLYIPYHLYNEIKKPRRYLTLCIIRDPRNIVVSWYFSMLSSHALMGNVGRFREELQKMDINDGLHYCIDQLSIKFADMRTWMNNSSNDKMLILKFENLTSEPEKYLGLILDRMDINRKSMNLKDVTSKYSKKSLRERDLKNSQNNTSHYREKSSDYKDYFSDQHNRHFKNVTGNLLEVLGYE